MECIKRIAACKCFERCLSGKNPGTREQDVEARKKSTALRDLSTTFHEHHLDRAALSHRYNRSRISVDDPTTSSGLTSKLANKLLDRNGKNVLSPPKELSTWMLFLHQFYNIFWMLLLVSSLLSMVTYFFDTGAPRHLYVAASLCVIVFVMCLISFNEEKKARNVFRGFQNLMHTSCFVRRDGREKLLSAEELVVGDLVFIRNGSQVPADVRLLSCSGLKLDTSLITGEAEPNEFTDEQASKGVTVFKSHNVAFCGSFCVEGEGFGIVINVADETIMGRIASLTTNQKHKINLLEKEIKKFVRFITILAVTMATVVFLSGIVAAKFENILSIFIDGFLIVIVANVPQGLPATLTSQLTIVARRMAKKNVFLKKLDVIETLGAATVIATDMTGTLTKNVMTVTDLWCNKQFMSGRPDVSRRTMMENPEATSMLEMYESPLPDLFTAITLCNEAHMEIADEERVASQSARVQSELMRWIPPPFNMQLSTGRDDPKPSEDLADSVSPPKKSANKVTFLDQPKRKKISGAPTEVALLRYASDIIDVTLLRQNFDIVFEIPFNAVRKWHLVIGKRIVDVSPDSNATYTLMMKGAPEILFGMCNKIACKNGERDLDENEKFDFQDAYLHFGSEGRRVIGFVSRTFEAPDDARFSVKEENYPQKDLCFLGMVAIVDPPKDDAAQGIKECKEAGIKVFLVTGDHPATATAVARQIGLIGGQMESVERRGRRTISIDVIENEELDYAIVHGDTLPSMSKREWDELLVKQSIVFARAMPEHKLQIVEELQRRGEIVVVTGDGVNDAPALKMADIGVAMGGVGSDVARQAADIILLDDNFASIVGAIEEGRLLYDNLKKTVAYTLAHLVPEIFPVLMRFALGFPVGLDSVQILSIDLGTELAPAISLAYESGERDIMKKTPRKRSARLVNLRLLAYSYLLVGTIITAGCLLAYFSVYWYYGISIPDLLFSSKDHWIVNAKNFTSNGIVFNEKDQLRIRGEAVAGWHIVLVTSQAFHLWMCTTRRVSIFRHGINNLVGILAVIVAILLVSLFAYTPGVQFLMRTSSPPYHVWFFGIGTGIFIWLFNESRKFLIRHCPKNKIVKAFKW